LYGGPTDHLRVIDRLAELASITQLEDVADRVQGEDKCVASASARIS
jgi:hypothetical protein